MKKAEPKFMQGLAVGVGKALEVFLGEKTPVQAARDVMKALEVAAKRPPRGPR